MATLNTRIKNRYDSLGEWQKPGVELLPGEIALVSVLTRQVDETTGETIDVPAVLMKIGDAWGEGEKEGKEAGTLKTFEELPWLSAKASDVYDWAKLAAPENIPVIYSDDTTTYETTLGSALSNLTNDVDGVKGDILRLKDAVKYGVHFIGITTEAPYTKEVEGKFETYVKLPSTTAETLVETKAAKGDIVIFNTTIDDAIAHIEFISAGTYWEELGDPSQLNALYEKINNLDYSEVKTGPATEHRFVASVTQTDGKISATYARPTAADVYYNNTTDSVEKALNGLIANKVDKSDLTDNYMTSLETNQAISKGLEGLNHTTTNSSGAFVTNVIQQAGTVEVTKGDLPIADVSGGVGVTALSSDATSEAEDCAATPKAVNFVYDIATSNAGAVGELNSRASVIENEYLRTSTNVDTGITKMYLGKYGTDEIIFDCGGAILNALITEGILAGASFTEVELNGSKYIKSSPFTISELGEYTYDIQVSNPSAYSMTFVDRSSWASDGPPCYALGAHESVSMGAGNYCLFISGTSDLSVADIISISLIKN